MRSHRPHFPSLQTPNTPFSPLTPSHAPYSRLPHPAVSRPTPPPRCASRDLSSTPTPPVGGQRRPHTAQRTRDHRRVLGHT
ncbi:hypothetical protein OH76DRAFT_1406540 [Lentinus brumalis]|uniref:Uncharacterized protein n=1 Tax=Lentinus brumalis TaxID=2498619 RepID=A0A371D309_9APHY|nr:hypothetical protein OH76DRAFT_1406540 [Polyporus brumalis]